MPSRDAPPSPRQAVVAAVQWALALGFVVDSAVDLLTGYSALTGLTGSGALPPSDQWLYAAPAAALVGAVLGYRWLTEGFGSRSVSAHRRRVRFVVAFLAAVLVGSLGLLVTAAWLGPLGTAQGLVVGAAFDLAPLAVAGVAGYRPEWLPSPRTPAGL
ncbi:hypothetical protein [Halolamina salifodinae]|uniref:Uncharacterized protein n=1 Tax=Halolamina salifodinae TaxID=1202767 RepID=A0A8T4GVJ2_9EURY|nr:hypothetical protein [Halolamina salifodinae]MBP1986919.1 hypothetical protein [Halolamina salifodinae]